MTVVTAEATTTKLNFLPDYCPRCNPLGHQCPDRRVRLAALTEPNTLVHRGGSRVLLEYRCDRCGHQWTRADLWDARSCGLEAA